MSTTASRTCLQGPIGRGAYCGRAGATIAKDGRADCANCWAAFRADERAEKSR